jgi:hypothetical protein
MITPLSRPTWSGVTGNLVAISMKPRTAFTATWSGFDLIFRGLQRPDDLQSWCIDPPEQIESGRPFMVVAPVPVPASDPTMSLMFRIDEHADWLWFDLS